jgi:acetoin utilization deacetylase AcuC-like enzyme
MRAISNGFCILNNAACAALYATTPLSENGPGLKRVCVIDIDVHHGNGTQNILCETYDPRFFYVSLHAGGALINGYEVQEENDYRVSVGYSNRKDDGIFPGRCGDTSPHKGVMNIPLGARVNAQDVGTALVSMVRPAVNSFAPDLIIVSAGFDAHKNDPLGMGGLSAEDFGHITETICSMANKCCSGRVLSILEGGYGIPCCRPQKDLFLPTPTESSLMSTEETSDDDQSAYVGSQSQSTSVLEAPPQPQPRPELPPPPAQAPVQPELLDLGNEIPSDMDDQVLQKMHKTLNRCHAEGFVDCVRKHVGALATCNDRSKS